MLPVMEEYVAGERCAVVVGAILVAIGTLTRFCFWGLRAVGAVVGRALEKDLDLDLDLDLDWDLDLDLDFDGPTLGGGIDAVVVGTMATLGSGKVSFEVAGTATTLG
eukprot:scaffold121708_cov53-Attheya_sp.AAC.1